MVANWSLKMSDVVMRYIHLKQRAVEAEGERRKI